MQPHPHSHPDTREATLIRFQCPGGHNLRMARTWAGKTVTCPKCRAKVTVPPYASRGPDSRRPAPSRTVARGRPLAWLGVAFGSLVILALGLFVLAYAIRSHAAEDDNE